MKKVKKKHVRPMVLLYVLTTTGWRPEEKQPESRETVNRFRTAIIDPVEGSKEYRNIVRELYRRIVYFDSLPASHPATPLFPSKILNADNYAAYSNRLQGYS